MANKKENQIVVERETYEKNGKQYFSYFVKGNVRGKDVKASVMPLDIGGYTVLDIVFGNEMKAELVLNPYEIKDEKTGTVMSGNTYSVRSVDENGEIYECRIKPAKNSDKSLLNMILR
ncbi:MAG: hypothetical protein J6C53_00705 [Clostridia bacterium]|nr:hypothetical protein [Clostridia bacterium]MBP3582007.1 hypothetical protein [Clostridia bacterium]